MNLELLRAIANATAANTVVYVGKDDGLPLLKNEPALISIDTTHVDPEDASKFAATITADGVKALEAVNGHSAPKPMAMFSVSTGLVLPKIKRGGKTSGAPTKYPFETMGIGEFFFVANTEVAKGDAMKTLGSAVGSANQRFSEEIPGTEHQVTRAKRGADHKTIKGADGKNVTETVMVLEKKQLRRFVVRAVQAGLEYGSFKAPADGVVVQRVAVE